MKAIEHCDHCNNSGVLICRCGGDVCVCGLEYYDCPYCDCQPENMNDDEDSAWDRYQTWGLACALFLFGISFAHAAVAPQPEPKSPIVCRVLDGSPHEREWLTREDAITRVDVIRTVLGVDVLMDCRRSSFTDHTQWALLAADAGVRGLDVYSTHRMLQGPNHEKFLPDCISHHTPAMIAYGGAAVGVQWLLARQLIKHGHSRLAKIITAVDVAQDGYLSINNLNLKGRR